jgi:hypothetical protein
MIVRVLPNHVLQCLHFGLFSGRTWWLYPGFRCSDVSKPRFQARKKPTEQVILQSREEFYSKYVQFLKVREWHAQGMKQGTLSFDVTELNTR